MEQINKSSCNKIAKLIGGIVIDFQRLNFAKRIRRLFNHPRPRACLWNGGAPEGVRNCRCWQEEEEEDCLFMCEWVHETISERTWNRHKERQVGRCGISFQFLPHRRGLYNNNSVLLTTEEINTRNPCNHVPTSPLISQHALSLSLRFFRTNGPISR